MDRVKMFSAINLVLFGVLTTAAAQSGKCVLNMTSLELQPFFDFDKYLGKWFEVKAWFHGQGFSDDDAADDFFKLYTKESDGVADSFETGRPRNSAECVVAKRRKLLVGQKSNPARLTWREFNGENTLDMAVYVVATDYDTYALTVGCTHGGRLYPNGTCLPNPVVHVLSRSTKLNDPDQNYLDNIINQTICHTNLHEYKGTFHKTPCEGPTDRAAVMSSIRFLPLVSYALVSIFKQL